MRKKVIMQAKQLGSMSMVIEESWLGLCLKELRPAAVAHLLDETLDLLRTGSGGD